MSKHVQESPIFLLSFGQNGDRWRVALRTAVATHYFVTLEDLVLFLEEQSHLRGCGEPTGEPETTAKPRLMANHLIL
jgi:hypothetical protein